MRRPAPLPDPLHRVPFSHRTATAAGVSKRRLRAADLWSPFHGVRAPIPLDASFATRLRAYAARMPPSQFFSHVTAARVHGIPIPLQLERDPRLHVSAADTAGFPRSVGVIGHHGGSTVVERGGLRLSAAVDCWCELATLLALEDLVVAGDYLVTGSEPFDGKTPIVTLEELRTAVRARAGRRGVRALSQALALVRYGSLSPMETRTRLLVVRAQLPEPTPNHIVLDRRGDFVAMLDLAFVEWKVGMEYQGDDHREKERFRRDITRRERIEDQGWTVVYVSADDILRRPQQTAARIRARLRARGAAV